MLSEARKIGLYMASCNQPVSRFHTRPDNRVRRKLDTCTLVILVHPALPFPFICTDSSRLSYPESNISLPQLGDTVVYSHLPILKPPQICETTSDPTNWNPNHLRSALEKQPRIDMLKYVNL